MVTASRPYREVLSQVTLRCIGIRLQDAPHRLACSTANSRNRS
jgi:hypothetical protein